MGDASREAVTQEPPVSRVVIQPSKGVPSLGLRDLWRYRELLYFLTWRDVLIRYKQAVLGVAWAVLQPFLTMIVFTVIFGGVLGVNTGSIPYPVFSFAGLLPWQLFSGALQRSGQSIVGNASLITKVHFPRLVIPISAVLAGLVDFAIAFIVLLGLMAYYHMGPTWSALLLPFFILFTLLTALAVSAWLSALNVLYRDVQYVIPFLVQLWMFLSPVMYPIAPKNAVMRFLVGINPMNGVIDGFRWALTGGPAPSRLIWASVIVVTVLLVSGLFYFRRMERLFADVV
jgi:lipopolysaccharide transport system permease protein